MYNSASLSKICRFCVKKEWKFANITHVLCISKVESFQDFLIQLDMKLCMHLVEISIFSLNNVTVRLTKIMNRADKKVFEKKSKFFFFKVAQWKDSINFQQWKITLKLRILKCLRRLFILLVTLMVTLFSENLVNFH